MSETMRVLVVDDDSASAELIATMLEAERTDVQVETTDDPTIAVERLPGVECIVCDYEMPEMTGLELLERVRRKDPRLPFILFTGRGSETIASEAIAAGVTHYLQKGPGTDRYVILANQVANAVSQYRAESRLRDSQRQYERVLTGLHEASRDLMRAETKDDIHDHAVETARELLEVSTVRSYAFDPERSTLDVVATAGRSRAQTAEEAGGVIDALVWDVFSTGDPVYDADESARADIEAGVHRVAIPLGSHGVLLVGGSTSVGFDDAMIEFCHLLAANMEAALDRAERETLLRETDRRLTAENERLTRLNHLNDLVREITLAAGQTDDREAIESILCDRLADSERYQFVWVATHEGDRPVPTAWSGIDPAYIDRIHDEGTTAPEVETIQSMDDDRSVIVSNVLEHSAWDDRRREAVTHGFQTVLFVRIGDDQPVGTFVVHAPGVSSIDPGERAVFEDLGRVVGTVIKSARVSRSMDEKAGVELVFECSDERLMLNRLSTRLDSDVSVRDVRVRDSDHLTFVLEGSFDIETLRTVAADWETVADLTIQSAEAPTVVELAVIEPTLVEVLRSTEVRLAGATAEDGRTELVLDLPQDVTPRSVLETFTTEYPETDLHAKRSSVDAPASEPVRNRLETTLTDRQLEALKVAHARGFFEWPRAQTGEELAETLDISPPTYHYHLRAAERKLVSLTFDDESR